VSAFYSQSPHKFKYYYFTLLSIIVFNVLGFAQFKQQQIEFTPFVGYFLTSNLTTLEGDLVIEHNFNYGGALDVRVSDDLFIELLYNRTDTEVRFKQEYFDTVKYLFDMSIEYFQAGLMLKLKRENFVHSPHLLLGQPILSQKTKKLAAS